MLLNQGRVACCSHRDIHTQLKHPNEERTYDRCWEQQTPFDSEETESPNRTALVTSELKWYSILHLVRQNSGGRKDLPEDITLHSCSSDCTTGWQNSPFRRLYYYRISSNCATWDKVLRKLTIGETNSNGLLLFTLCSAYTPIITNMHLQMKI